MIWRTTIDNYEAVVKYATAIYFNFDKNAAERNT